MSIYDKNRARKYRIADEELDLPTRKHFGSGIEVISKILGSHLRVLDLGCGTGRYFHYLKNTDELVAIDASKHMINEAKDPIRKEYITIKDIKFIIGDLISENFLGKFDFVYSIGTLGEHVPFDANICNKICNLLNDHGIFYTTIVDYNTVRHKGHSMLYEDVEMIMKESGFDLYSIDAFHSDSKFWKGTHFCVIAQR